MPVQIGRCVDSGRIVRGRHDGFGLARRAGVTADTVRHYTQLVRGREMKELGGGTMTGATLSGGMMGNGAMGGISWMWIPTLFTHARSRR